MIEVKIADKLTLDAVKEIIGSSNDVVGAATIFARLAELLLQSENIITAMGGDGSTGQKTVSEILTEISVKGSVKKVQRGITSAAGTITINPVDMSKSFVVSNSKGSSGYVAARGSITGNLSGNLTHDGSAGGAGKTGNAGISWPITLSGTRNIAGGTTDLTTKAFSAQLTSSTTLECDGPVEWQVIEFV